jgi:hypothetical protein
MRLFKSKNQTSQGQEHEIQSTPPAPTRAPPKQVHENSIQVTDADEISAMTNSPSKTVDSSSSFSESSPTNTNLKPVSKSLFRSSKAEEEVGSTKQNNEDPKKKKKTFRFKKKNKKENRGGEDKDGERIVIGDEYAIVSVHPKGPTDRSIPWEPTIYPVKEDQEQAQAPKELKKQRFSMLRMKKQNKASTSTSDPNPAEDDVPVTAPPAAAVGSDVEVGMEEPVLTDPNEGYELPRSMTMPAEPPQNVKKSRFSFRRSASVRK